MGMVTTGLLSLLTVGMVTSPRSEVQVGSEPQVLPRVPDLYLEFQSEEQPATTFFGHLWALYFSSENGADSTACEPLLFEVFGILGDDAARATELTQLTGLIVRGEHRKERQEEVCDLIERLMATGEAA